MTADLMLPGIERGPRSRPSGQSAIGSVSVGWTTAGKLVLVVVADGLIQKLVAELTRYALGTRRLPKDDE